MLDRFTTAIGTGGWGGRLLLIAAVLVAFYLGTTRPAVSIHTAVPSSAERAISVTVDDWT